MKNASIDKLIQVISQLPGIGPRSAKKISMYIASQPKISQNLISSISEVRNMIVQCVKCNNLDNKEICSTCSDEKRDKTLCLLRNHIDLNAVESTRAYHGYYLLIGDNISPSSDAMTPLIEKIKSRVKDISCKEIIIALSPSIENRIVAQYLLIKLKDIQVRITTIGLGMPMGGSFEYMDSETIVSALESRRTL